MSKFNYFKNILVDSYGWTATPQASWDFNSTGIALLNRSRFTIQYSFGDADMNVHGDLVPGDPSRGIIFDNRVESKVFFRSVDGYGYVRCESWK
jgi:hypothetical protein